MSRRATQLIEEGLQIVQEQEVLIADLRAEVERLRAELGVAVTLLPPKALREFQSFRRLLDGEA